MSSTQSEYIGVLGRAHGLDGTMQLADVVVLPSGLRAGCSVGVGFSRDFTRAYTVEMFTQNEHRTLIKLKEITSAEMVTTVTDQAVFADANDLGISSTERYRIGDIEGATVFDEAGQIVGTITDVWLLPANDVWVVTTPNKSTIPLPVIDDVIVAVDLQQRSITVRLLEGLDKVDVHEDIEPDA
ncbi:MAG: ribosome maturation factor RimM [Bacteroidota bacterium]